MNMSHNLQNTMFMNDINVLYRSPIFSDVKKHKLFVKHPDATKNTPNDIVKLLWCLSSFIKMNYKRTFIVTIHLTYFKNNVFLLIYLL